MSSLYTRYMHHGQSISFSENSAFARTEDVSPGRHVQGTVNMSHPLMRQRMGHEKQSRASLSRFTFACSHFRIGASFHCLGPFPRDIVLVE